MATMDSDQNNFDPAAVTVRHHAGQGLWAHAVVLHGTVDEATVAAHLHLPSAAVTVVTVPVDAVAVQLWTDLARLDVALHDAELRRDVRLQQRRAVRELREVEETLRRFDSSDDPAEVAAVQPYRDRFATLLAQLAHSDEPGVTLEVLWQERGRLALALADWRADVGNDVAGDWQQAAAMCGTALTPALLHATVPLGAAQRLHRPVHVTSVPDSATATALLPILRRHYRKVTVAAAADTPRNNPPA